MTKIIFRFVLVFAFAALLSACNHPGGGGCINPAAPGCGDDGGGNPPPGQGGATARYAVFEGDCPDDPSGCSREIFPTEDPALREPGYDATYLLKDRKQIYTLWVFVDHPEVPGRRIESSASIMTDSRMEFDEGDPAWKSPARMSLPFSLTFPGTQASTSTKGGGIGMSERPHGNLPPLSHWSARLFFRAPR